MKYVLFLMMMFSSLANAADPTLKITAPVQNLAIGASTTVTFTFSEAVTGFTVGDINVLGDATLSGFSGSGTTYTVNVQKLADRSVFSLVVDNNATAPAGHGGTIGFNVAPKVFVKEFNAFTGKLVEAVPQPRCPLEGEYLADSGGNPTSGIVEDYYILTGSTRAAAMSLEKLRFGCLTRLIGGLQYLKKVAPKTYETANVHGGHNHSTLMPKITKQQIQPLVGTTKTRVKPFNLTGCNPDGSGKYTCFSEGSEGDFRASQFASKLDADDPIVYPNQKGAAHLHTFYGNNAVNYQTTTASLIKNCVSLFSGGCANATGYWMPSVIDLSTNIALLPQEILIYYKAGGVANMPFIEPLPQGLKIIAGNPAANSLGTITDGGDIECFARDGLGIANVKAKTFSDCAGEDFSFIRLTIGFPQCVADNGSGGMQLDSVNHRSHLANTAVGQPNGCPLSHPHRIAGIAQVVDFPIQAGQNTKTWRLSSDNYSAAIPGGWSLHADWWGGWKIYWANRLNDQCNKTLINCGVNYIGLNDGVGITNITTVGNIATITTDVPHLLKVSNPDGSYPDFLGEGVSGLTGLRGRISGVTGADAAAYNFDATKVTNTDPAYPNPAGTVIPVGSQQLRIKNATQIEYTLNSTPATPINGAVNPATHKVQWGEQLCRITENCNQAYSDFYYGTKQ